MLVRATFTEYMLHFDGHCTDGWVCSLNCIINAHAVKMAYTHYSSIVIVIILLLLVSAVHVVGIYKG